MVELHVHVAVSSPPLLVPLAFVKKEAMRRKLMPTSFEEGSMCSIVRGVVV